MKTTYLNLTRHRAIVNLGSKVIQDGPSARSILFHSPRHKRFVCLCKLAIKGRLEGWAQNFVSIKFDTAAA